jgi:tRNA(Ile)-lysidine synthase
MNVLVEHFQQQLQSLSVAHSVTRPAENYVVAYSGGMDSHVLLHLCYKLKIPVRAIHINHGLQKEADAWSKHCNKICEELNVPFFNIHVDAAATQGESPENAARNARYEALMSELKVNECLLTAHHKDDQSETLLLQLFRGAGPAGLAAMPVVRKTGKGIHLRPLLECSRSELMQYAKENKLNWIEDPSNQNTDFDRNFVRQKIIPLIKGRWQQVDSALEQVASQQQDSLEIIEAMAAIDLSSVVMGKMRQQVMCCSKLLIPC